MNIGLLYTYYMYILGMIFEISRFSMRLKRSHVLNLTSSTLQFKGRKTVEFRIQKQDGDQALRPIKPAFMVGTLLSWALRKMRWVKIISSAKFDDLLSLNQCQSNQ